MRTGFEAQTPFTASGAAVRGALSRAQTSAGEFISWREHVIDDIFHRGNGAAGRRRLVMADLDRDGHLDVSVHESDAEYDRKPDGLIRLAFGSAEPHRWVPVTLASRCPRRASDP